MQPPRSAGVAEQVVAPEPAVGLHVAPVALVGVEAFGFDPGDANDLGMGSGQRVAVVRVAGEGLRGEHEALAIGGGGRDLGAELITLVRLALGDAHHFGRMRGGEPVLVMTFLRQQAFDQR